MGKVKIALGRGRVVTFQAVFGNDWLDVIDKQSAAPVGGRFGFGRGEAVLEKLGDVGW